MICRACLRAGGLRAAAVTARAEASSRQGAQIILQTTRTRSLFSTASIPRTRSPIASSLLSRVQPSHRRIPPSSQRPYSAPAAAPPTAPEKPGFLSEGEAQVWDLLLAEFAPTELVVQDISGGCGSMYGIEISSERFRGLNMLKQQRLVNSVLGDLLKGWHGVQLKTRVP
ncbi:bola protein [Podospora appendiculata]|uniref:Bola protein n=1 Tax=Podospora appendiculata TaxID=314037 RepID=A0AAE0X075_9PEZI|nr:bola protein [Podospora appendiculata]